MTSNIELKFTGEHLPALLQEALSALRQNRTKQAHRLLLEIAEREPQNVSVWLLLGQTALTLQAADFYFQRALALDADNSQAIDGQECATANLLVPSVAIQTGGTFKTQLPTDASLPLPNIHAITGKKSVINKPMPVAAAYLLALGLAEILTALVSPVVGMLLYSLLLVVLLLHASLVDSRVQYRFLLSLSLVPLIRLISLSMPLVNFPIIYWYAILGVPLSLAVFLVVRRTGLNATKIGLTDRALPLQLAVGMTGYGLGYVGYLIMRPDPLASAPTWGQVLLPALILLVFTGLLEEIIFRGLMHRTSVESLGRAGVFYVAAVYAVLYLGYGSVLYVGFVFAVALFFGVVVARTGSLLGVTLAHSLMNITMFLVIPFLL